MIRDIYKVKKENSMGISFFGYENEDNIQKNISKKCC